LAYFDDWSLLRSGSGERRTVSALGFRKKPDMEPSAGVALIMRVGGRLSRAGNRL